MPASTSSSVELWTRAVIDELCRNSRFHVIVWHMKHAGFVCERKLDVNKREYEVSPKKPDAIQFLVDGRKQRYADDVVLEWSNGRKKAVNATNYKKHQKKVESDETLLEARREQSNRSKAKSTLAKKEDGHFKAKGLTEQQLHTRLYEQFIDCVVDKPDGKKPRWLGMHNSLLSSAPNQKKFGKLKDHQVNIFFELAKQLHTTVETKFGGKDSFHGLEDKKWNIIVWFSVILELAAVDKTESKTDCWTSKLIVGQGGRPFVRLYHGLNTSTTACALSAILNPHQAKVVDGCIIEASHICSNHNCYKIDHCVFESKTDNNQREDKCLNRCQLFCKCEPKCLPIIDGKLVKCRVKNCQCIAVEVRNVALETPHDNEVNELKRQLEAKCKELEVERKAHGKTKELLEAERKANMELTKKANVKDTKFLTPDSKHDSMKQFTMAGSDDEQDFATPDSNSNLPKKSVGVQTSSLLSPKERQQSLAGLLGTIRSSNKRKLEDPDEEDDKKKVKKEATVAPKPLVSRFSASTPTKKSKGAKR